MIIKEQLIQESRNRGFKSVIIGHKQMKYSDKECLRYFLWLTELQKWLREEHNIHIEILLDQTSYPKFAIAIYQFIEIANFKEIDQEEWFLYRTYEEALEKGLQEALKLIK